jgi:hypothetical protein
VIRVGALASTNPRPSCLALMHRSGGLFCPVEGEE